MKTGFAAYFAAYVALVLGAGLVFSRRMKSLADFFLAARDLPGGFVFLALTSSWFGATSILVATDRAYAAGLTPSGSWGFRPWPRSSSWPSS